MGCIYLRKNKVNGKCYVGQTKDIKIRNRKWKNLKTEYAGKVINNARAKYGVDGFSFELLKECPNEDMNYWEMYYIKIYNSKTPYGYNSTDGGDSGYEMTDEVRKKIAAALRGRKRPDISAAKRGKPNPKVAAAKRGKKLSPEHITKIAAALKGKPKPKLAAALRGRKRPVEVGAKIALAHRGMKHTEETKAKMSAAKSKAVLALDKNGNVVYEFPSTAEAQRQGFSAGHISECCLGKLKTYKGFIWCYAEK